MLDSLEIMNLLIWFDRLFIEILLLKPGCLAHSLFVLLQKFCTKFRFESCSWWQRCLFLGFIMVVLIFAWVLNHIRRRSDISVFKIWRIAWLVVNHNFQFIVSILIWLFWLKFFRNLVVFLRELGYILAGFLRYSLDPLVDHSVPWSLIWLLIIFVRFLWRNFEWILSWIDIIAIHVAMQCSLTPTFVVIFLYAL